MDEKEKAEFMENLDQEQREKFEHLLDLTQEEELHPDLVPFLVDGPPFGLSLKHPLHYSIMHNPVMNRLANQIYTQKKAAVEEYLAEGNYHGYVWMHERPYRLEAFMQISDLLSDTDYWKLLGNIWTDSENIWQNLDEWEWCLSDQRGDREQIMDDEEREFLAGLDDELTVYRGYRYDPEDGDNDQGFSWTLDKSRAEWFARRLLLEGQQPMLVVGKVKKSDVIAYFNGRGEDEIVSISVKPVEKHEIDGRD